MTVLSGGPVSTKLPGKTSPCTISVSAGARIAGSTRTRDGGGGKGEEQGDGDGGAEDRFEYREMLVEPDQVRMMAVALRARGADDASPESVLEI